MQCKAGEFCNKPKEDIPGGNKYHDRECYMLDLEKTIEKIDICSSEHFLDSQKKVKQLEIHNRILKKQNETLFKNQLTQEEYLAELFKYSQRYTPFEITPPTFSGGEYAGRIVPMFCISDVHLGKEIKPSSIGGIGGFNLKIFKQQCADVFDKLCHIIYDMRKNNPVESMIWPFHGDIIEGHDKHPGFNELLEIRFGMQIYEAAHAFAKLMHDVSKEMQINILWRGLSGNHATPGRRKDQSIYLPPDCSFDWLIYKWMQDINRDIPSVTGKIIEDGWFMLFEIFGVSFCIIHGEDIYGWSGIPFYGIKRAAAYYQEMLDYNFDHFICGHIHTYSKFSRGGGYKRCFSNSTWCGPDQLAKKYKQAPAPEQLFLPVYEKFGVMNDSTIMLWKDVPHPEVEKLI